MKGTFFQKPYEYQLEVEGNEWHQGDTLKGSLRVKNHSGDSHPPEGLKLFLAKGQIKKVQTKNEGAFELIEEIPLPSLKQAQEWEFPLSPHFLVSDNTTSPYLLYGVESPLHQMGQLQLFVKPQKLFMELCEVMESHWGFVKKTVKSKKGDTEFKLTPPSGKRFGRVDQLLFYLKQEENNLTVRYQFTLKKIDVLEASSLKVKKEKVTFDQDFPLAEFLLSNGHLDKTRAEAKTAEIMKQVQTGE